MDNPCIARPGVIKSPSSRSEILPAQARDRAEFVTWTASELLRATL